MSSLRMTGKTDTGMVRDHNEDCFLIVPESGIAILADGMGGHQAGEVASAMAIDQVTHHLLNAFAASNAARSATGNNTSFESTALVDAIKAANAAIHDASMSRAEQSGMAQPSSPRHFMKTPLLLRMSVTRACTVTATARSAR